MLPEDCILRTRNLSFFPVFLIIPRCPNGLLYSHLCFATFILVPHAISDRPPSFLFSFASYSFLWCATRIAKCPTAVPWDVQLFICLATVKVQITLSTLVCMWQHWAQLSSSIYCVTRRRAARGAGSQQESKREKTTMNERLNYGPRTNGVSTRMEKGCRVKQIERFLWVTLNTFALVTSSLVVNDTDACGLFVDF
jgi:hypothetical protein